MRKRYDRGQQSKVHVEISEGFSGLDPIRFSSDRKICLKIKMFCFSSILDVANEFVLHNEQIGIEIRDQRSSSEGY
jgi:hypothetical protein